MFARVVDVVRRDCKGADAVADLGNTIDAGIVDHVAVDRDRRSRVQTAKFDGALEDVVFDGDRGTGIADSKRDGLDVVGAGRTRDLRGCNGDRTLTVAVDHTVRRRCARLRCRKPRIVDRGRNRLVERQQLRRRCALYLYAIDCKGCGTGRCIDGTVDDRPGVIVRGLHTGIRLVAGKGVVATNLLPGVVAAVQGDALADREVLGVCALFGIDRCTGSGDVNGVLDPEVSLRHIRAGLYRTFRSAGLGFIGNKADQPFVTISATRVVGGNGEPSGDVATNMGWRGNTRSSAEVVTRGIDVRSCRRPLQIRESFCNITKPVALDLDRRSRCAFNVHTAVVGKGPLMEIVFLDDGRSADIRQRHCDRCLRCRAVAVVILEFVVGDRNPGRVARHADRCTGEVVEDRTGDGHGCSINTVFRRTDHQCIGALATTYKLTFVDGQTCPVLVRRGYCHAANNTTVRDGDDCPAVPNFYEPETCKGLLRYSAKRERNVVFTYEKWRKNLCRFSNPCTHRVIGVGTQDGHIHINQGTVEVARPHIDVVAIGGGIDGLLDRPLGIIGRQTVININAPNAHIERRLGIHRRCDEQGQQRQ